MIKSYSNEKMFKLQPDNFQLETTSIWSFPNRGSWASHNGSYRGNWSPYIPRNIILRYSKKGDIVLDQFLGSGTTLIEATLLERRGIGIDINPNSIKTSSEKLYNLTDNNIDIYLGDARKLDRISNESIDLICSHPPYANIIKYSSGITGDLSNLSMDDFLSNMGDVAKESYRVLKNGKYCSIMMGDIRKNKNIIPLGFKTMEIFTKEGFVLKEIIIKEQHNCSSTRYWEKKSVEFNFLLIAHEYLFIFHKI